MTSQKPSQTKKTNFLVLLLLIFSFVFLVGSVKAEGVTDAETVGSIDVTVCCEKTNAGLFCQNVKEEDCSNGEGIRAIPTSCRETSFCKPGFCYDSDEGICLDNVPQMVCNNNNGTWSEEKPAACGLGCCILGDQASFVTLVRCKRLSSFYGLETNWNSGIQNEPMCILTARSSEKGACVFEQEFETTCELTTRTECTEGKGSSSELGEIAEPENSEEENNTANNESSEEIQESPFGCEDAGNNVKFCPGILCSAEELNTNCGPSRETTCLSGREEVYFVDTCGNPANIYDASMINNDEYWAYIKDKSESCKPDQSNENSQTCGNCNYLLGSYCRETSSETTNPTYGTNICKSLNCEFEGQKRLHGESWCKYDVEGFNFKFEEQNTEAFTNEFFAKLYETVNQAIQDVTSKVGVSNDFLQSTGGPVGSKFYRLACIQGEVLVEPCADFRQEECIENNVAGFSEAACRVNRWQDCTAQFTKSNCENYDRRDCLWLDGIEYVLMGGLNNGSTAEGSSLSGAKEQLKAFKTGDRELGACVPKIPPGLNFYGGEEAEDNSEAAAICSQANAVCPVKYEKGLVGSGWECVENCECLEEETQVKRAQLCMSLGDCGPKTNFIGQKGSGKGYKIFEGDLKDED